ncbi:MAG: T9SS type A sorting domain-containing protein [Candidatus Kapaibacterium sp.]
MCKSVLIMLLFLNLSAFAQEGTVSSGGDAKSTAGSVSYSIGQVLYEVQSGEGQVQTGLQQPYRITITSIEDSGDDFSIEVFPNPSTDNVTLKIDESYISGLEYSLVNLLGNTVITNRILSTETYINTKALTASTYILNIVREGEIVQSFKLIKEK